MAESASLPRERAQTGEVVLRTRGLTKRFGRLTAVDNLNLELQRGEVFGFLGPNGSGKSTTVGMILGLLQPTAGTIELFGQDLAENRPALMRRVGAIIETPAFYPYLSGKDNLKVIAATVGNIGAHKVDEVLAVVGLSERARDKFRHYSLGMKQRLGIASTLLKDPELVMLDEPTNGLDPAGTREVRELIPQLAAQGRTVFLCSHLLHEVELTCERVAILKQGRLLSSGKVKDLLSEAAPAIQIKVQEVAEATRILSHLSWVRGVHSDGDYLVVDAHPERIRDVSAALATERIFPLEIRPRELDLESFFLEVTGGVSNA